MQTDKKLNQLEQIKVWTTVVADTADFESIREFKPQDATTNPSLVYAATQKENYSHFLDKKCWPGAASQDSAARPRSRTSLITCWCDSAARCWKLCRGESQPRPMSAIRSTWKVRSRKRDD